MSEQTSRCANPRCVEGWISWEPNPSGVAPPFPCRHPDCPWRNLTSEQTDRYVLLTAHEMTVIRDALVERPGERIAPELETVMSARAKMVKALAGQPKVSERGRQLIDDGFHDGLTTFWFLADNSANEAIAKAASYEGPFTEYVNAELVTGRIEQTSDGPYFHVDSDGDVVCWEIDAQ